MDNFINTYIDLIFENYDYTENGKYTLYGSYKGINLYININHIKERLLSRYVDKYVTISQIITLTKKFIKILFKENNKISLPASKINPTFPFVIKSINTTIYIAGSFKSHKGIWRCYIKTVLPPTNTYISKDDCYREIN